MPNNRENILKNGIDKGIEEATQKVAEALNALAAAQSILNHVKNIAPEQKSKTKCNIKKVLFELVYVLSTLVTWWDRQEE